MYRIMTVVSHRDKCESLYKFMTSTIDGVTMPLEIETEKILNKKITQMLNKGGYSKKDFVVVEMIDYNIDVNHYTDDIEDKNNKDNDCECNGCIDETDVATDEEVKEVFDRIFGNI